MKVSVVTISFNQAEFLERTIQSVLRQSHGDVEYILVDPGSTDGSREIIEKYRSEIACTVFERDKGAADGLNRGFAHATGDIFFYLNSDDTITSDAFELAVRYFTDHPDVDAICGHGWAVAANDEPIRRIWSDPYEISAVAYSGTLFIQPSTFIRAAAFRRTAGFNVGNPVAWDDELLLDLHSTGAKIVMWDVFASFYRLHASSITASGSLARLHAEWMQRRFERIKGRKRRIFDKPIRAFYFVRRYWKRPQGLFERLFHGPVYRRYERRRH